MTTQFQEQVYAALSSIPKGKVSSYKDVALKLGICSSQAIGQACKRNPRAPKVPCHRVVSSSGKIGGFSGKTSGKEIQKKIALLKKEGVRVSQGVVVDFEHKRHIW